MQRQRQADNGRADDPSVIFAGSGRTKVIHLLSGRLRQFHTRSALRLGQFEAAPADPGFDRNTSSFGNVRRPPSWVSAATRRFNPWLDFVSHEVHSVREYHTGNKL